MWSELKYFSHSTTNFDFAIKRHRTWWQHNIIHDSCSILSSIHLLISFTHGNSFLFSKMDGKKMMFSLGFLLLSLQLRAKLTIFLSNSSQYCRFPKQPKFSVYSVQSIKPVTCLAIEHSETNWTFNCWVSRVEIHTCDSHLLLTKPYCGKALVCAVCGCIIVINISNSITSSTVEDWMTWNCMNCNYNKERVNTKLTKKIKQKR